MHRNAVNTHAILEAARTENEAMRVISQRAQIDSRSTRILTSITIVYLPANLVAVRLPMPNLLGGGFNADVVSQAVFSSNMVQSSAEPGGISTKGPQIGYFILSTMVLTLAIVCVTLLWERELFGDVIARIRRILRW